MKFLVMSETVQYICTVLLFGMNCISCRLLLEFLQYIYFTDRHENGRLGFVIDIFPTLELVNSYKGFLSLSFV
jgi:hypothetical protein